MCSFNPNNSGRGPQITQIPANGKDFQQEKTGFFFPGYLFPSPSFYSRSLASFAGKIRIRVCAGEAGSHVGESPTGRIRRFTTERDVRKEAARLNLQAGHLLNQQAITKVNSIQ
jgi:hypothetical protein